MVTVRLRRVLLMPLLMGTGSSLKVSSVTRRREWGRKKIKGGLKGKDRGHIPELDCVYS